MVHIRTTTLVILALRFAGPAIAAERRPNIVILLADDND
jgi:hypothetical protein